MKINEGYKSAVYRYNSLTNSEDGRNFVSLLNRLGIPKEHLLWAVDNIEGEQINIHIFIQMYKEWKEYVLQYYKKQNQNAPEITQLTYQEMSTIVDKCKTYWAYPNVVYNQNGITVCELKDYMDAHMLPIETTWCITKIPQRFEEFCGNGKKGYYIINNNATHPYERVLSIIINGDVEYWDADNKRMAELPDYVKRFREYEKTLPQEVKNIFYNEAANQGEKLERNNKTDKNESKNMNKKNTIRLSESDLKRVISESVKKVLKEDYVETPHENKELLPILRERSSELRKMCLEWKKLYKQVYPQWEGEESWYNRPSKYSDVLGAIETLITELENAPRFGY